MTLPERVPDFGPRSLLLFRLLFFPVFLLALAGPIAGTWQRLSAPPQNSALVPGSRAGVALAAEDLTRIRFPVGPEAVALGIRSGDKIVAIDSIPLSASVPMPPREGPPPPGTNEADYALFGELLYGTDSRPVQLRLRVPSGGEREVKIVTGEHHIDAAAAEIGVPRLVASVADLLHLLTYPFLLASAWLLYRRRLQDAISSLISLAILLTMASEQPSAAFLAGAGVPEWAHRALYDAGNLCLLAGILLFPHGRLGPRPVLAILAALPLLLFLEGDAYRAAFFAFIALSVATLVWRVRSTPPGDERQQLKWALFGFSGYALFLVAALSADMLKVGAGAFAEQLALELFAGFAFGLAFLLLQLGLLVALLKYRLYDAEAVISRSASIALVTLILAGAFAATMEAVKELVLAGFGREAGSVAPIVGAAISTVLVSPAYERVQRWAERRFHRNLVKLRAELPEALRDLRHFATLPELAGALLDRVEAGVRPTRIALAVEEKVAEARGVAPGEAEAWLEAHARRGAGFDFDPSDRLFPVRVALEAGEGPPIGWLLLGPRPDRSCLSTAERDALTDIAEPAGRALKVVLKREARERELAATLARQQRQIDELGARLAIDRAGTAA
jgi:hypothetical protein